MRRILSGLSCRKYEECAEAVPEAFGLSGSTISRRYIRASARALKEFCERRLDEYDFVALILDGKAFGADEMIVALGITVKVVSYLPKGMQVKQFYEKYNHSICKE